MKEDHMNRINSKQNKLLNNMGRIHFSEETSIIFRPHYRGTTVSWKMCRRYRIGYKAAGFRSFPVVFVIENYYSKNKDVPVLQMLCSVIRLRAISALPQCAERRRFCSILRAQRNYNKKTILDWNVFGSPPPQIHLIHSLFLVYYR